MPNTPTKLTPLKYTCDWEKPTSDFERYIGYIPIIGWAIRGSLNLHRYKKLLSEQRDTIRNRPDTASHWPSAEVHREFVLPISELFVNKFEWPSPNFIPSDAMAALATLPVEDLELTEFFMGLEEVFGVDPTDQELTKILDQSLGEFVDWVVSETKNHPK